MGQIWGEREGEVRHMTNPIGIARDAREVLGARLAAYIASVDTTRELRAWVDGEAAPPGAAVDRLRLALQISEVLLERDSGWVVQAWFQGMNPELDDQCPARLIRESNPRAVEAELMRAARLASAPIG